MREKSVFRLLLLAGALSCEGSLGGGEVGPRVVEAPPVCGDVTLPGATPQLIRLAHAQYDHVLSDLLGLTIDEARTFTPDPVLAEFDNDATLGVDARLLGDYQETAEAIAQRVVTTPAALATVVTCTPSGDGSACARETITSFGRRAFRRPLTTVEVERYAALYAAAGDFYTSGSDFERGIRLVIEAMIQSPHFLYRAELDEAVERIGEQDVIRLTGYTIASRLASTLWASFPDDALLDAAARGDLDTPEGIRTEAERMVQSPKLTRVLDDFHAQWMDARKFGVEPKVPALPEGAGDSMRAEVRELVRYIAANDGGYEDLMTAPYTFADENVAPLYSLTGTFGPTPTRVDLDPAERSGLLTQVGILSSHASATQSAPIHRGVFVMRRFLCSDIEPPGFMVDPVLPERTGDIVTTRDQVEAHTADDTCQACHARINALGFSLENYDAVGGWRTEDNGAPVDASGDVRFQGEDFVFDGAVELASEMIETGIGPRCYVNKWLGYSFGREPEGMDRCTASEVEELTREGGHKIRDVLVSITQTNAFRYRLLEE
jgi:hypothetical protein